MTRTTALAIAASLVATAAACRTTTPAPGSARATPSFPPASSAESRPAPRRGYTEADVRFMQGMIAHHGQALEMTILLQTRTARDDMRLLAERISVSQREEIALMQRWLRARGETVPDPMAASHVMPGHDMSAMGGASPSMPGMLTADEMERLAAARGPEFDRLFLEDMIKHHEGALAMVRALFASPGAGQESELYRFASDVEADQRAEIARMRALLSARSPQ